MGKPAKGNEVTCLASLCQCPQNLFRMKENFTLPLPKNWRAFSFLDVPGQTSTNCYKFSTAMADKEYWYYQFLTHFPTKLSSLKEDHVSLLVGVRDYCSTLNCMWPSAHQRFTFSWHLKGMGLLVANISIRQELESYEQQYLRKLSHINIKTGKQTWKRSLVRH